MLVSGTRSPLSASAGWATVHVWVPRGLPSETRASWGQCQEGGLLKQGWPLPPSDETQLPTGPREDPRQDAFRPALSLPFPALFDLRPPQGAQDLCRSGLPAAPFPGPLVPSSFPPQYSVCAGAHAHTRTDELVHRLHALYTQPCTRPVHTQHM